SPFPASHQLILANSLRQAEKGGAQRVFFNRGVFAYRFAFLALQRALREKGPALGIADELIEETTCLGDVRTERFSLETIYRLLLSLPERIAPAALRQQFPEAFEAAARGCFGSADPADLTDDVPLRGAALYGLGRVDRGLVMPVLLARGSAVSMAEFGLLMSISHDGDRVTRWRGSKCDPYMANQERLDNAYLDAMLAAAHGGPGA